MTEWPPRSSDRLLEGAVDSVGAVELLLVLRAGAERPLDVADLCAALGSPRSWTVLQLEALARAGLAEPAKGRWRYAPASPRLAAAVDDLADAWRRDSGAVRRWVFGRRGGARRQGSE